MARTALGKGLSALIREPEPLPPAPGPSTRLGSTATSLQQVEIELIDPNPYQPRTHFREEALQELTGSIRASGIIQPLILRSHGPRYQLIAGERRWRAAQRAGMLRVPAVVREVPDALALEITLVENLQREDLNPIEQARAFERLMSEFHLTQEEVAERTGKDRATVANVVRLLKLDTPVQQMLEEGRLSAGHGRALLSVEDVRLRLALAQRAARGQLSVRQTERLASQAAKGKSFVAPPSPIDPNIKAALDELQRALGTKIFLRPCSKRRPGHLVVEFYDDRQLMGLYDKLMRSISN